MEIKEGPLETQEYPKLTFEDLEKGETFAFLRVGNRPTIKGWGNSYTYLDNGDGDFVSMGQRGILEVVRIPGYFQRLDK